MEPSFAIGSSKAAGDVNYGERRLRQQGPSPFGPNQLPPRDRTPDLPFVGSSRAFKN
jgi:hypothetical protein